jgi:oligoribonuclease
MADNDRLVWIDLEMTGLDPVNHSILEIATVVTDGSLELIAEGPDLVIHQPEEVLLAMNEWSRDHHAASGLTAKVRESAVSQEEAERQTLEFLAQHCVPGLAPLAGNSVHMDRFFLKFHMPKLEAFVHYRNVDVTTVKELARRWNPKLLESAPRKKDCHRARDDIFESVAELRHYRDGFFQLAERR